MLVHSHYVLYICNPLMKTYCYAVLCRFFSYFLKKPWFVFLSAQLQGNSDFLFWFEELNDGDHFNKEVGGVWSPASNLDIRLPGSWSAMRWHHLCFSLDSNRGRVIAVDQTDTVTDITSEELTWNKTTAKNFTSTKICIMKPQESDHIYNPSNMIGRLTDLQLWSRSLTSAQMMAWTQCRSKEQGDLVAWGTAVWQELGLNSSEVPLEEICSQRPQLILLPQVDYLTGKRLCQNMGGNMKGGMGKELDEVQAFWNGREEVKGCGGMIWMPYEYDSKSDHFIDSRTQNKVVLPHSDTKSKNSKCVVLALDVGQVSYWGCRQTYCTVCQQTKVPTDFYLRGTWGTGADKAVDQHYVLEESLIGGFHSFRGAVQNRISYSQERSLWQLEDLTTGKIVVSLQQQGIQNYPIGTSTWRDPDNLELRLNLGTCGQQHFSCGDGQCVPLSVRCDNKLDCSDGTDEERCQILKIPTTYVKDIPPPSNVTLDMDIYQIVEIKEDENSLTLRFSLNLKWKDVQLEYINLRDEPTINMVPPDEMSRMWVPEINFPSLLTVIQTDTPGLVSILKEDQHVDTRKNGLVAEQIFSGWHNTIVNEKYQTMTFTCTYSLDNYPFDRQDCKIGLAIAGLARLSMWLLPGRVQMVQQQQLQQYEVTQVELAPWQMAGRGLQGAELTVRLERRVSGLLLTTYLPTIMMNIINQATMYIDSDRFFETILTTNITCMTVLASLYILFSSVVPQTSYTKSVDIWFLFNLTYPFCLILLHIIIEHIKATEAEVKAFTVRSDIEDNETELKETILNWQSFWVTMGKRVLPGMGLLFVISYFMYYSCI